MKRIEKNLEALKIDEKLPVAFQYITIEKASKTNMQINKFEPMNIFQSPNAPVVKFYRPISKILKLK